jgi:hypothetical protein
MTFDVLKWLHAILEGCNTTSIPLSHGTMRFKEGGGRRGTIPGIALLLGKAGVGTLGFLKEERISPWSCVGLHEDKGSSATEHPVLRPFHYGQKGG